MRVPIAEPPRTRRALPEHVERERREESATMHLLRRLRPRHQGLSGHVEWKRGARGIRRRLPITSPKTDVRRTTRPQPR